MYVLTSTTYCILYIFYLPILGYIYILGKYKHECIVLRIATGVNISKSNVKKY